MMTDNELKELVNKHDAVIGQLVTSNSQIVASIDNLVIAQRASNDRLSEISILLGKQDILSIKLDTMDKDIQESFNRRDVIVVDSVKRLHSRIDELERIQKSDSGCSSVKLMSKDIDSNSRDIIKLTGDHEEHRIRVKHLEEHRAADISPITIKWITGMIVAYSITFGTFIVQRLDNTSTEITKISSMLERDMKDTDKIMSLIYNPSSYNDNKL